MRRLRTLIPLLSTIMASALLLGGCGGFFGKEQEKSPAQLMREAMEDLEKGRYEEATEAFQKIKDRYPYSEFAVDAELKMADALFKRGLYEEAADAYKEFEKLHPKNKHIPYVIYQKGMCHFNRLPTIDRDQTQGLLAKEEFERLVKRFPRDEHARKVRMKIRQCFINLAEYELYVGHFYLKKKEYRAAMGRFRYLVENYPDLGQYHEALYYYGVCKREVADEGVRPAPQNTPPPDVPRRVQPPYPPGDWSGSESL